VGEISNFAIIVVAGLFVLTESALWHTGNMTTETQLAR
jgi:hypothetical protein